MIKLDVNLFDTLQWKWIDFEIIAETEEKALEAINIEYPLEFRGKPYSGSKEIDSLIINYKEKCDYFIIGDRTN